jgi:hypothetical protein
MDCDTCGRHRPSAEIAPLREGLRPLPTPCARPPGTGVAGRRAGLGLRRRICRPRYDSLIRRGRTAARGRFPGARQLLAPALCWRAR